MTLSPVCSYNEWGPLEEVVVGRLEGAMIPSKHLTVSFNIPQRLMKIYKLAAGLPYPKFVSRPAQRELDEFIHILEAEGITVRRPAEGLLRHLQDAALAVEGLLLGLPERRASRRRQ